MNDVNNLEKMQQDEIISEHENREKEKMHNKLRIKSNLFHDNDVHLSIGNSISEKKIIDKDKFTINGDTLAYKMMKNPKVNKEYKDKIHNFFLILSLCHSVFIDKNSETDEILYQGSSPDDIELVKGASQFGYSYVKKDFKKLIIKNEINDEVYVFELLAEMPFDSTRKRMSVLVEDCSTKKIYIFSKGADTVMNELINWSKPILVDINEDDILSNEKNLCEKISELLCKEGLRILFLGFREISREDFELWNNAYLIKQKNGKCLTELYKLIENNLNFVGLTAIEDKLQDGVDEAIKNIMSCGIKFWVLTGDKEDTALEIAKSCNLIVDMDNNKENILKYVDSEKVESDLCELLIKFDLLNDEFLDSDFLDKLNIEKNYENRLEYLSTESQKIDKKDRDFLEKLKKKYIL